VLANGWFWNAWSALELGDRPAWTQATEAFADVARQLGLPFEQSMAAIMASTVALLEGRYADSEELSQRALALGIEGGDPNAHSAHLIGAVLRGLDLGQAPDMIELMKAMRTELADVPTFMGGLTMTAAVAGDHDLANELLAEQTTAGFERAKKNLEWLPSLGFLAHACAVTGDQGAAQILHDELQTSSARAIRIGPIAAWFGPVDYHLGALCRVLNQPEQAEERLRSAIRLCEEWNAKPWLARAQGQLAVVLANSPNPQHQVESVVLRVAAQTLATELGAPALTS
jgi:tetratricopeptide (TPR) repeat protein